MTVATDAAATPETNWSQLAPIGLMVAALIVVDEITLVLTATRSLTLLAPDGRFQLAIHATNALPIFTVASMIALATGHATGSTIARRAGLVLLVTTGALALASLASMWFDGPVLREMVPVEGLSQFVRQWGRNTAIVAAETVLLSLVVLAALLPSRQASSRA